MPRTNAICGVLLAMALLCAGPALAQGELRIALQDDPDSLDPALNWTFVGRHVLQSLCDKIVDIDANGGIVPMIASAWAWAEDGRALTLTIREGATFHDGTPVDAEAVRFNLDRDLTLRGSRRRTEIDAISGFEVMGPRTLRILLKEPSIPLLAALTDRAGMLVSPKAAADPDFAAHPVCAGPYRFVERRAQDRIVLERFPAHWRADKYKIDRLVFRGQPDSNVRLLNLRAGQFDLIERLSPNDVAATAKDPALTVADVVGLGFYNLTFNVANGAGVNPALTRDARRAFDLALDRYVINQVAFGGAYQTGNQPFPPGSTYYDATHPVPPRDLDGARKLMAGRRVTTDLLVPTDPERAQVAQIVQSMVAEAGIDVRIQSIELISLLDRARQGLFQSYLVGWSGRVDPDLNISPLLGCGASGNDGHYCNEGLQGQLTAARATSDVATRKRDYAAIVDTIRDDAPTIYLYHGKWIFAHRADLHGFAPFPDGIMRFNGVTLGK